MRYGLRLIALLLGLFTLLLTGVMGVGRWGHLPMEWIAYVSVHAPGGQPTNTQTNGYEIYLMRPDGSDDHRITFDGGSTPPLISWSPYGDKLLVLEVRNGNYRFYTIRPNGQDRRMLYDEPASGRPSSAWSPDDRRIALSIVAPGSYQGLDIYVLHANRRPTRQITQGQYDPDLGSDIFIAPAWSPDGQWIAFKRHSPWGDGYGIYLIRPDGSEMHKIVDEAYAANPRWSPDGQWIAFVSGATEYQKDIFRVRPDGSEPEQLTDGKALYQGHQWSPDGQWLLFTAIEHWEVDYGAVVINKGIYVVRADGSELRLLTNESLHMDSYGYASGPQWSPDSQWIVYAVKDDNTERDNYLYNSQVFRIRRDGTGKQQLTVNAREDFSPVWSPRIDAPFHGWIMLTVGAALVVAGIAPWSRIRWRPRDAGMP